MVQPIAGSVGFLKWKLHGNTVITKALIPQKIQTSHASWSTSTQGWFSGMMALYSVSSSPFCYASFILLICYFNSYYFPSSSWQSVELYAFIWRHPLLTFLLHLILQLNHFDRCVCVLQQPVNWDFIARSSKKAPSWPERKVFTC